MWGRRRRGGRGEEANLFEDASGGLPCDAAELEEAEGEPRLQLALECVVQGPQRPVRRILLKEALIGGARKSWSE